MIRREVDMLPASADGGIQGFLRDNAAHISAMITIEESSQPERVKFHVVNGLNQNVAITWYGCDEEDKSDAVALGPSPITYATTVKDYETVSDPFIYYYFSVTAAGVPTSGQLKVHALWA